MFPSIQKNRAYISVEVKFSAAHDSRQVILQGFLELTKRSSKESHSFRGKLVRRHCDSPVKGQHRCAVRLLTVPAGPIGDGEIRPVSAAPPAIAVRQAQLDKRSHVPYRDIGDERRHGVEFFPSRFSFAIDETPRGCGPGSRRPWLFPWRGETCCP